jgi:energy-coupling factor transporter ATP-binding protein EcfA2
MFPEALGTALASAHGLGLPIELTLDSGPGAGPVLEVDSPAALRWFAQPLADAYSPARWQRTGDAVGRPKVAANVRAARRRFEWPEPLGLPSSNSSSLDAWCGLFQGLSPGVRLRWKWSSVPPPRAHWWEAAAPPPVIPLPPAAPGGRRPTGSTTALPARRPMFGALRVTLGFVGSYYDEVRRSTVVRAVEAATRSDSGNGLLFDAAPNRDPSEGRPFYLALDEWPRFWPTLGCPGAGGLPPSDGDLLTLGRNRAGVPVGPTIEAHQGRHVAILGETGMGKSSLLVALGRRQLARSGGLLFDPMGETAADLHSEMLAGGAAPPTWIAPGVLGSEINALEGAAVEGTAGLRRVHDLVHALRRVRASRYEESAYWGPRIEEMLTRALRAAAALPSGTLVEAHLLLETGGRLGRPVPPSAVEPVRELADRIRDRPEDADGARRLLHEVVGDPVLRQMLCASRPRVRTASLVAPGRVVLISGEAGRVGETSARYLLSIFLALVWSELLARPSSSKTFVLLDEAQWFAHESLAEMLRIGRRRNLHVILATQAVGSLPRTVAEAVWTNVADFVAFRGAPEEAREMARATVRVTAPEILALPRGEAIVLLGKGESVHRLRSLRIPATAHRAVEHPAANAVGPPVDGVNAPDPPADRVGILLERVLELAAQRSAPGPFDVDLESLRAASDPSGRGVRELGSVLGRAGLLDRGAGGSRWRIDAERLARWASDHGFPPVSASAAPQPS